MYTTIQLADILNMPKVKRLNLINSIVGFKSANLIGTKNTNGRSNLAIFSSVIHMGSNPPIVGMVLRPTSVARHTYENIKNFGFYTINHVHHKFIANAHQTSAKYKKTTSEFDVCDFTEYYSPEFPAPYVIESKVKIGVSFVEEHPIKINGTLLVVGQIMEIILPEKAVEEDGFVKLSKLGTSTINGLDMYGKVQTLSRFEEAQTNAPLKEKKKE